MIMLKKYTLLLPFLLCFCKLSIVESRVTPIVLWHGMDYETKFYATLDAIVDKIEHNISGDSCCFSFSLGAIKKLLEAALPNVYVYSIRLGSDTIEDVEHSYLGNINEQISEVCELLSKDERLKDGYNAVGFSQGAQFIRAVIQRCPNPPVLNFISLGGQHQGVFGFPNCGILGPKVCNHMIHMIKYAAYLAFIQKKLVQATYWHDPYQEDEYKKSSIFMSDINNELRINQTYKDNLQKLRSMVLVKFANDTMVRPIESEWFGFYKSGQEREVQSLEESDIYRKDRLGLKALHEAGKIHFLSLPGNHLQFTQSWFVDNIIKPYLM